MTVLDPSAPVNERELESLIEQKVVEKLDQALSRLERPAPEQPALSNRVTLVVFSGELDRLMAAFVIATGAVAMGMSVSMYFTFWGLAAVKKKTILSGKAPLEKMMAKMTPAGPGSTGTSSLNMLGLGPIFFKQMMRNKNVSSLEELIALAEEMGVRMIGCQMSMDVMGITQEELIDNLDYGGVATYLGDARDSRVTLFV